MMDDDVAALPRHRRDSLRELMTAAASGEEGNYANLSKAVAAYNHALAEKREVRAEHRSGPGSMYRNRRDGAARALAEAILWGSERLPRSPSLLEARIGSLMSKWPGFGSLPFAPVYEAAMADLSDGQTGTSPQSRGRRQYADDDADGPCTDGEGAPSVEVVLGIDVKGDSRDLVLTAQGKPKLLMYTEGKLPQRVIRRDTAPGRIVIAAARRRIPKDVTESSWRRAKRAVRETCGDHVELRGSADRPTFSQRVEVSEELLRFLDS